MAAINPAKVIARARENWTNNPETEGGADAFDRHIALVGVQPFGELYQEVYTLANEDHEFVPGRGQAQLDERKARAAGLWEEMLPAMEAYAAECRSIRPVGWSR